jgi:hypothetical protein
MRNDNRIVAPHSVARQLELLTVNERAVAFAEIHKQENTNEPTPYFRQLQ